MTHELRPLLFSVLILGGFCAAFGQTPADLVVLHGKIYTENPSQPRAEAVAIRDGKIVAVGAEKDIEALRGPSTQVIDAQQHMVLPGFTDAHVHFIGGSTAMQTVALDTADTVSEIQKRVKSFAAAHPDKKVITGYGWMYPVFGKAALPDKKILDEVVPDRPVVLSAYDHHTTWANSKALQMAGINRTTPNPLNGAIVRDPATGEATGALKESAGNLVERILPAPTHKELLDALRQGLHEANRFGIVSVHSAGGDGEQVGLFDELRKSNELTVRFYFALFAPVPDLTPAFLEQAENLRRTHHDDWLAGGAIKFYADGVIESHTAAMLAPYSDDPKLSGQLNWTPDKYLAAVAELDRRGFQIFTHSIGDKGIRLSLDTYEKVQRQNGTKDPRYRVEHIEDPDPADIPRFGKLGIIASMQPLHAYPNADVLDVWARNVGPKRAQHAWPWHSIAAAGGHLAFGSDWPVVTLNPWLGIQNLLTRQTTDGKPPGGWIPQECITVDQAIAGYTIGAAYAGKREKTEGSLERGKLGDLIVISQNLYDVPARDVGKTEVLYTVVGGKIVYRSPATTR
ncbi:MAG: amidohydrolase [Bryobacteraceae bacterium]|jgi:predicted amidohydrolase YtcJ